MGLHKIVLIDDKGILETVCMVNHKSLSEKSHLYQDLLVLSQMDNYIEEATKYANFVKEIHKAFVNKSSDQAKDFCIKNKLNFELIQEG